MANDQVKAAAAFTFVLVLLLGGCVPAEPTSTTQQITTVNSKKPKSVVMSVALFGYQDRPIFDVYMNGVDIGVSAGQPFRGNAGISTGTNVQLGPQVVTWRLGGPEGAPNNGDTVKAVNQPIFTDPGEAFSYLGVHIYPDNTVELVPEKFWPESTAKGLEINREWIQKHGK